jgi:predicted transposase YbfD/YdcC
LVVRPVQPCERRAWRQYIAEYHYLGHRRLVGESICYLALRRGEVLALIGWGAAALKNSPRDAFIGWNWATKTQRLLYVACNVRFLVVPWVHEKNLASRVLALNLKRLSQDWERRYGHPIYLAETFVDPARFRGTCYRASNWIEVGRTGGWARNGLGYEHHGQPKIVFVYPLHGRARALLNRPKDRELTQQEVSIQMNVAKLDVSKLPLAGQGGLLDVLRKVTDCRKPRGIRHPLVSVLAFAVCATLAGMRSFAGLAQWADEQTRETRELLGNHRRTPASKRTFERVLGAINAEEVDKHVAIWISAQESLRDTCIALDGKTLRGSGDGENPPIQLLCAVLHHEGLVVAQAQVSNKTNEIPVAKSMLKRLDIEGSVITADALHTQRETAEIIVEKKANYTFTVKDNQPTLRQAIEDLDWGSFPPQAETVDKGHGRLEIRQIWTSTELNGYVNFPHCGQVFRIERTVRELDGTPLRHEIVYGITSLSPEQATPSRLLEIVRGHWEIENGVHYVRDVTFDEDRSQIRKGSGPRVMASLRNLAINLFRLADATNVAAATRTCCNVVRIPLRLIGLL